MAKQVKCPRCGTPQRLSNFCISCNMDFKEYARKLKQKREAAQSGGNATQADDHATQDPGDRTAKMVKCPKCAKRQSLSDNCVKCGMDFKAYMRQLKQKRAAAQAGANATQVMGAEPWKPNALSGSTGAGWAGGGDDALSSSLAEFYHRPGQGLRDLGVLFEDTWAIFKKRFGVLLLLNLLAILILIVPTVVLSLPGLVVGMFDSTMAMVVTGLGVVVGILVGFVLMCVAFAGQLAAIEDPSLMVKTALKAGQQKVWSYIWVIGLVGLVIPGGYMLLFVPGLLFTVWFFFAHYIVVLEPDKGMSALLKSKAYVRGYWWPVLGRLMLIFVLSGIVGIVPFGQLLFNPFMMIYLYLIYRDLREEKGTDVAYPQGTGDKLKWILIALAGWLAVVLMIVVAAYSQKDKISSMGNFDIQGSIESSQTPAPQGSPVLITAKNVYGVSEIIWLDYSAMPGNQTDWINIMPASSPDSAYRDGYWYYLEGKRSGRLSFSGLPPGDYEIRAYYDWDGGGGYNVQARKRVTILAGSGVAGSGVAGSGVAGSGVAGSSVAGSGPDSSGSSGSGDALLLLDDSAVAPGGRIVVNFTAPAGLQSNAWIGIIPSNVTHGSEAENDRHDISYQYLQDRTSGSLTFVAPSSPGSYDFRMHDTDSNGAELTSVTFTVLGDGAAPVPSPPPSQSGGIRGGSSSPDFDDDTSSATGQAEIVLDGKRETFVLNTDFFSDTRFADPRKAQVDFSLPQDSMQNPRRVILILDATKTGAHIVDGTAVAEGFMGESKIEIGFPISGGYEASLKFINDGGQVFFPAGSCTINVTSPYTGMSDSAFSGEVHNCTVHSAGIDKLISSFSFTMQGVPPH